MANIDALIRRSAHKWGVNPRILRAQLMQESGLREDVTSSAGARDIGQFMPDTARAYHVTLGDHNPRDDIDGAAHYMHDNLKRTHGSYAGALSIYNSGRADAYKDPHFAGGQTSDYVKKILGAAGGSGPASSSLPRTNAGPLAPSRDITVPDTDMRQSLLLNYLQNRHDPNALLDLASGLRDAQSTVHVPGSHASPHSDPQAPHSGSPGFLDRTGVRHFEGKAVAGWIKPILKYARKHGWEGDVTSGYRSDEDQTRIYQSGVRPAALPQSMGGHGSNHEFKAYPGGAVDASDAEALDKILRHSKYRKLLKYAGSKDPVHFSHPHNGSY